VPGTYPPLMRVEEGCLGKESNNLTCVMRCSGSLSVSLLSADPSTLFFFFISRETCAVLHGGTGVTSTRSRACEFLRDIISPNKIKRDKFFITIHSYTKHAHQRISCVKQNKSHDMCPA
jgi:hypothetical protein